MSPVSTIYARIFDTLIKLIKIIITFDCLCSSYRRVPRSNLFFGLKVCRCRSCISITDLVLSAKNYGRKLTLSFAKKCDKLFEAICRNKRKSRKRCPRDSGARSHKCHAHQKGIVRLNVLLLSICNGRVLVDLSARREVSTSSCI